MRLVIKQTNLRKLSLANIFSSLADGMDNFLVFMLVVELTNSPVASGIVLMISQIPGIIFSIIGGYFTDKYKKEKIMIIMTNLQGTIILVLFIFSLINKLSFLLICIAIFLLETFSRFYSPAFVSMLVSIIKKDDYTKVNSFFTTSSSLISMLGPSICTSLIAFIGYTIPFVIISGSYFIIGLFIRNVDDNINKLNDTNSLDNIDSLENVNNLDDINSLEDINTLDNINSLNDIDSLEGINNIENINNIDNTNKKNKYNYKEFLVGLKEGFIYLKNSIVLINIIIITSVTNLCLALFDVSLLYYIQDYLFLPKVYYGYMKTCAIAGSIIAGFLLSIVKIKKTKRMIILSLFIMGVSVIIIGYNKWFVFILILWFIAAFFRTIEAILLNSNFCTQINKNYIGRVLGISGMIYSIVVTLSYGISGFIVENLKLNYIFVISGIIFIFWSIFVLINKNVIVKREDD